MFDWKALSFKISFFKGTQEYEAILATPRNGGQEKYPLIVFPHGIVLNFWLFYIEFNEIDLYSRLQGVKFVSIFLLFDWQVFGKKPLVPVTVAFNFWPCTKVFHRLLLRTVWFIPLTPWNNFILSVFYRLKHQTINQWKIHVKFKEYLIYNWKMF